MNAMLDRAGVLTSAPMSSLPGIVRKREQEQRLRDAAEVQARAAAETQTLPQREEERRREKTMEQRQENWQHTIGQPVIKIDVVRPQQTPPVRRPFTKMRLSPNLSSNQQIVDSPFPEPMPEPPPALAKPSPWAAYSRKLDAQAQEIGASKSDRRLAARLTGDGQKLNR